MTSNRPLEEWGKLLCDVPTAGAILDRFLHHAEVIHITGKSYRLAAREKPPKDTKSPPGRPPIKRTANSQRIPLTSPTTTYHRLVSFKSPRSGLLSIAQ